MKKLKTTLTMMVVLMLVVPSITYAWKPDGTCKSICSAANSYKEEYKSGDEACAHHKDLNASTADEIQNLINLDYGDCLRSAASKFPSDATSPNDTDTETPCPSGQEVLGSYIDSSGSNMNICATRTPEIDRAVSKCKIEKNKRQDDFDEKKGAYASAPSDDGKLKNEDRTACESTWANLTQVQDHCKAVEAYEQAWDHQNILSITYTVAAVTCTTACGLAIGTDAGITEGVGFGFQTACSAASGGAAINEFIATMDMQKKLGVDAWGGSAFASILPAAGSIATQTSTTVQGWNVAGETGAGKGALGSCITAGLMDLIATLKWVNKGKYESRANDECRKVKGFEGGIALLNKQPEEATTQLANEAASGNDTYNGGNSTNDIYQTGGGTYADGEQGGTSGTQESFDPADSYSGSDQYLSDTGGIFAKAADDPLGGNLLKASIDPRKVDAALSATGTSIKAIADALKTSSPSSLLASMAGQPPMMAQMHKEAGPLADEILNDKNLKIPMGSPKAEALASTQGGGAGTKGATQQGLGGFGGFGSKAPTLGTTGDMKYSANEVREPASTDIFHSNFNGNIFEIVSNRYEKSINKVEKLDWSSKLNKAYQSSPKR